MPNITELDYNNCESWENFNLINWGAPNGQFAQVVKMSNLINVDDISMTFPSNYTFDTVNIILNGYASGDSVVWARLFFNDYFSDYFSVTNVPANGTSEEYTVGGSLEQWGMELSLDDIADPAFGFYLYFVNEENVKTLLDSLSIEFT